MALNWEKARRAVKSKIGDHLGLIVEKAAWGIRRVVDENMSNAAKVHIVEKDEDPTFLSISLVS
jgi:N-methylhydantoinase A